MTEAEKGYAAGLIDGEGCISVKNKRAQKNVNCLDITMCDKEPIEYIAKLMDSKVHCVVGGGELKRPRYTTSLHSKKARAFILEILPYLRNKRAEATLFLDFGVLGEFGEHHRWQGGVPQEVQSRRDTIARMLKNAKRGGLVSFREQGVN